MKPSLRGIVAWLVLSAAWLAGGGVAEAFAPLPDSRIDPVAPEPDQRIEMMYVLPEWANAELAGPLTVDEHGLGYFARSVVHLRELLDREENLGREHPAGRAKEPKVEKPKVKKPKGIHAGTPSEPGPPRDVQRGRRGRPDDPGLGRGSDTPFRDLPILPEPLERAYGEKPAGDSRPTGTGEAPEPSASALLALAIGGWLGVARSRRPL